MEEAARIFFPRQVPRDTLGCATHVDGDYAVPPSPLDDREVGDVRIGWRVYTPHEPSLAPMLQV